MEIPQEVMRKAEKRMEPFDTEGFVLGGGRQDAEIMVVGEAPGELEAEKGEPFVGRAGNELDKQLHYLGIERDDMYITSVVRSRPYKWVKTNKKGSGGMRKANRKPNAKEIFAHAPILDYQIETINPSVIIALGGVAYQRLTGRQDKLSDVLGTPITTQLQKLDEERGEYVETEQSSVIFPLYHPAAVFYNPTIKSTIYEALDELRGYLTAKALI
ncbi:uracil-DNA glycosylase [Thalassobacillus sp. CUG 92003]|uniref:uracil-DNA glycosylase n=1 Tax=Thalassobacillus sp. CUG 92003 TaxID=2736641 RepID=UPI0015E78F1E|nr:uracil-DNA glycosylase [Thalassobacillus sp. CUG 92003]